MPLKSGAGGLPAGCFAQTGEIFKEGVDGGAQGAGEQAAFVAGVGARVARFQGTDCESRFVVSHPFARKKAKGWLGGGRQDEEIVCGGGGNGFDLGFCLCFGLCCCLGRSGGGQAGGLPVVEAGANLFLKGGPGGGEQAG